MKLEGPFNQYLGRILAKAENPDKVLEEQMQILKKRTTELNDVRQKMAEGYKQVLVALAQAFPEIDLNDPNLKDSHNRMARALIEVCSGLGSKDSDAINTTFPAEDYNEVIILKNIDFTSLCSHHFFPFSGIAHIGYLPDTLNGGKVLGLSKLARILDIHAQRPQLQERLCQSIMEALKNELKPAGVMVVIEAKHGCLNCRGARKRESSMITSALDGKFQADHKLRAEFLSLISLKN